MGKDIDSMNDDEFLAALEAVENGEINEDTDPEPESVASEDEPENEEVENIEEDEPTDDTGSSDNDTEDGEVEDTQEKNQPDDEDTDSKEDDGDTSESSDEEPESTSQEVDYKKEYEELQKKAAQLEDFYNQVTGEFVANGRKMRGFTDPKKIIQAQQMAAGFAEKMKVFKQYKPFMQPLKEKGLLDNPDKFALALDAIDGNPEAIKALLKEQNIDPMELDLEDVKYQPKDIRPNELELVLDDVLEMADQNGVGDHVRNVIAKEWDDQSLIDFLQDPQSQEDLITHMQTGIYDLVQERIAQHKISDPYGTFNRLPAIEQYRAAARELEQEYMQWMQQQQMHQQQQNQAGVPQQQAPGSSPGTDAEEYARKVKENAEAMEARKRAASVSKKKPRSKPKQTKKFDPLSMSDEEIENILQLMINGEFDGQ